MKIEILFPEVCNLFGDSSNSKYLIDSAPDADFVNTSLLDEPAFIVGDVNMVYMGSMTESAQEKVIAKLLPYKAEIEAEIERGVVFLFTGNAMDILGEYIENEDGSKIPALGLFKTHSKRDMMHRYNGLVLGEFHEFYIVGFQTQFTKTYGNFEDCYFQTVKKGMGMNKKTKLEGLHRKNLFATSLVGPLLVLNPIFTKMLLELAGSEYPSIAHETAVMAAYEQRLREFKNPKIKID